MRPLRLVLATGGTGGHIYPALAVARAAAERGHRVAVLGQQGGMEAQLVPDEGFAFSGVRAGKWDRQSPDPRQALAALRGVFEAVGWMRRERPDLVAGFGGYASFPGCLAAAVLGVPLVLYEGNAFPGRVTRWFARRARLVLASQPAVAERLPQARELRLIGFPVRRATSDRRAARAALGLPQEALVTLVMGGSQGSVALNRAVPNAFERLDLERPHLVLHSSGERWYPELSARVADLQGYRATPFVDAGLAWPAADLAITRAGFSTLAEAASFGVPLIAVPLPSAAEDHQRHNAAALEAAGAGRMLEEDELASLAEVWRGMLEDDSRDAAARNAAAGARPGAAAAFVDLLEEVATCGAAVLESAA